jgi:PAS domain S-box-containing protein
MNERVPATIGKADGDAPATVREAEETAAALRAELAVRDALVQELRESEAKYQAMFGMASDAIFLIDAETKRILEVNRAAEELYGYDRQQLLTMRNVDVSAEPDSTARAVDERRPSVLVRYHRKRDGTVFPVEITGSYFRWQGRDTHIAMVRDITERVRLEERREDVERIIRHELRSPIASLMHLYLLLDRPGVSPAEQCDLLRTAQETTQRMMDVVTLHQDLYQIETGAYQATPEPVDIGAVVEEVLAELRTRAKMAGVRFDLSVDGAPAARPLVFAVSGHRTLCRVMVANLLRNALDASPEGAAIRIVLRRSELGPELSIHNAGAVPASIRHRFFEKYATSGKSGGTGLGAYTAKLIADAIGRGIAMQTSETEGTVIPIGLRP